MWATMHWVLLGAGGAVGAILRYAIGGWVQQRTAGTFPWGTITVNVAGCLFMGLLARILFGESAVRPEYRTAILVGVLGALTTFSTFSYETISLLNDGQFPRAAAYVVLTNVGCLAAVWIGYRLAEQWAT